MDIAPQKLRRARETAFLTQVELGHEADVTEMTISRLGLGLGRARIRTVRKLAAALGIPPADLLNTDADEKGEKL